MKYLRIFTCSLLLAVSPLSHNPRYTSLYCNSDDSCSLLSLSSGPVSFSSAGRETEKVYTDSTASCHIDGHRYKQGWDHYVDARGLMRSHRLAVTTSCIQWNRAVWYIRKKKEDREEERVELFCWLRTTKRNKRTWFLSLSSHTYSMYYVSALLLSVCFCPDTFLIGLLLSILFPSTVFYSLQLSCYCQCVPRTYTYWRKPLKLVARPWQPYPSTLSVDFVTFCAVYTHLGSSAVVGAEQQRKLPFLIQTRN